MTVDPASLTRRGFCAASAGLAMIGFSRLANAADAESDETITQIAKFKLNLDNKEEGLQALKDLCAAVEENEPGVLAYICHQSAKNPEELVFFEVYENEDALKAHGQTPHIGKLRMVFSKFFLPPLEITRLDRVGGFAR